MSGRKILIATFGSLGDLHPFVALGHALARKGLRPVIATSAAYADHIAAEGLAFAPVRPCAEDLTRRLGMSLAEIAVKMAQDDRFLFEALIFPHLRESFEDLWRASEGASAMVAHGLSFSARLVAEARGLPLATVLLSPMMLCSAEDPPQGLRIPLRPAPASSIEVAYNRFLIWSLSHVAALWAEPLRRLRRELGLKPRHGLDLLLGAQSSDRLIGLFSPLLTRARHGSRTHVVGHTFHDRFCGVEELSPQLSAFLEAGEAPLVFTLGSFVARAQRGYYLDCVEAARRLGRRAVLLAHEDDVAGISLALSGDAFVAPYAPHSLVFPRAWAVIHHGGIGTAGQALRAGRPQLVTPFLGDQFDNAERLRRLGVARVLDGESLTREALCRELSALDGSYVVRGERVARRVREEDGATAAAAIVADLVGHQDSLREKETTC